MVKKKNCNYECTFSTSTCYHFHTEQFQRLGQAAFGEPTKRGDELNNYQDELQVFLDLEISKLDPEKSMAFKLAEYQKAGIRNLENFYRWIRVVCKR